MATFFKRSFHVVKFSTRVRISVLLILHVPNITTCAFVYVFLAQIFLRLNRVVFVV